MHMSSSDGEEIRRRRKRIGLSISELAQEAGISRDTLSDLESGKNPNPRESTVDKLDATLTKLEGESGLDTPAATSDPHGLIEFEVKGDFGVSVVVRGPVEDADELQRSVVRIIRDIRSGSTGPDDPDD